MKTISIFLATLLLASCSSTGMSSGSSMNGESSYGYGSGVQSSSSIYPRTPSDTYYGD